MAKFLTQNGGQIKEAQTEGTGGSGGAADKIPHLDVNGRLPTTMMPTGFGDDTEVLVASEALAAGDYVNVWSDAGTPKVRKADATVAGKEAHGFVRAAVTSGANATVYFEGANDQVTGQTAGPIYLQTTAGKGGATVPNASGNVVQQVGFAVSATKANFQSGTPIVLA